MLALAALALSASASDVDPFEPSASFASGRGTLQAEDPLLAEPGFTGSVVAAFVQDPVVRVFDDGSVAEEVRALAPITVAGGWVASEQLRVDFLMPVYAWVDSPLTSFQGSAVGDARLQATVSLWRADDERIGFGLVPRLGIPSGTPRALVAKGVNGSLLAALGGQAGAAGWTVNTGFSIARNDPLDDASRGLGSTFDATGGLWANVVEGLRLGGEVDARVGLARNGDGGANHTAAGHLFAQGMFRSGVGLAAGAGTGFVAGLGSPEYRVLAALTFATVVHDADADGIVDENDPCPTEPEDVDGFEDLDGCPELDNDADGVLDVADLCPIVPEDLDAWADDDGCPDPDNDEDGVADADDACPLVPGLPEHQGCPDTDGDGLADAEDQCPAEAGPREHQGCPDRDQDGVPDLRDRCPDEPKPADEDPATSDGCPKTVYVTQGEIKITERVEFETGKAVLRPESSAILDKVVAILLEYPSVAKVEVQGHTDNVGSDKYNLDLSGKRAAAVRAYLIKNGVHASRLVAQGYGESQPLLSNKTPKGRDANRRVQFLILEGGPVGATILKSGPEPAPATVAPAPAPKPALPPAKAFPPGSPPGVLTVKVANGYWATVAIDGRPLTKAAPFAGIEVEPGRHELHAYNPRVVLEWTTTIDVEPGQPLTVVVPAGPDGRVREP